MVGLGAGDDGLSLSLNVPGGNPNEWGDAAGSRLPNSLFGSGAGDDIFSEDPSTLGQDSGDFSSTPDQGNLQLGDSGKSPTDTSPTDTFGDTSGLQSDLSLPSTPDKSTTNTNVDGGGFSYYYNLPTPDTSGTLSAGDSNLIGTTPAAAPAATDAAADPTAAATDTSDSSSFANTLDDLSSGAPPTAPSLSDWENMGPFGQAALQYALQSAGYNWAPYSEAMLQGWRNTGQADPNTGMSGYAAPHVTALGLQSMNPLQQEALQQNAELFGTWGDYQNREQRAWQTGARPMTNIKA
jgi:hypothetical protein